MRIAFCKYFRWRKINAMIILSEESDGSRLRLPCQWCDGLRQGVKLGHGRVWILSSQISSGLNYLQSRWQERWPTTCCYPPKRLTQTWSEFGEVSLDSVDLFVHLLNVFGHQTLVHLLAVDDALRTLVVIDSDVPLQFPLPHCFVTALATSEVILLTVVVGILHMFF